MNIDRILIISEIWGQNLILHTLFGNFGIFFSSNSFLLTYLGFSTREGETQEEGREKFHLLDSIGRLEAVSVSLRAQKDDFRSTRDWSFN